MPRGGAQPGSGRPKGSVTKRSSEVHAAAIAAGISPLEYMLQVLRDPDADPKMRAWAAEKAAPYLHARPAPMQRIVTLELPDMLTPEGIAKGAGVILNAAARGEIAPAEAQSLMAVVEMQRKAIETGELLKRIEDLEARQNTTGR
jgi:hypothetical protein